MSDPGGKPYKWRETEETRGQVPDAGDDDDLARELTRAMDNPDAGTALAREVKWAMEQGYEIDYGGIE